MSRFLRFPRSLSNLKKKASTTIERLYWSRFKDKDVLDVAFITSGGVGDMLMFLNYIKHFVEWADCRVRADYFHNAKMIANLHSFDDENWLHGCYDRDDVWRLRGKYDLILEFRFRYPRVIHMRHRRVKYLSRKIPVLADKYLEFEDKNRDLIDYSPKTDGLTCDIARIQGDTRLTQPDLYDLLSIQKFCINIPIKKEAESLSRFDLVDSQYVLVNRSVDSSRSGAESTKLWPKDHYHELITLIKEQYPQSVIVMCGPHLDDYDYGDVLDLRGKTSFNDLLVLIRNAKLLICPEGGMAHLRAALHAGKSCVLFGPTSIKFYGYKSNINLTRSEECIEHCEWIKGNWQECCIKNGTGCCNKLLKLTAEDVLKAISPELESIYGRG